MTRKTGNKPNGIEWGHPSIDEARCTGCGSCAGICSSWSITMKDGKPVIGSAGILGCLACGHCVAVCPSGAVRITGRGMTGEDLLPLPPRSARASADSLEGLLRARRSTRRFEDRPVERETIDRLLDMGSTAPMGFPPTPVGVVVINGKERVRELAIDLTAAFRKWLFLGTPAGSLMLRLMMDKTSAEMMRDLVLPVARKIIEEREEGRDLLFYDAPCVILFHYPMKDTIDPAIACSFTTIAAEALGLGSCMIGTVAPALQGDKKLKSKWGIPARSHPSLAMILGYPSVKFLNGVRRRFASVEHLPGPAADAAARRR